MDLDLAARYTSHWEGLRATVYNDTKGIPTIGVGFNLTTPGASAVIAALGLDYSQVLDGAIALTTGQIDQLLQTTLQTAVASAQALIPNFDSIPTNQQIVVTDLVFNMGQATLATFVHTLAYIQQQSWPMAAYNLKQSLWFTQVGSGPTQRGGADVAVLAGDAQPTDFLS